MSGTAQFHSPLYTRSMMMNDGDDDGDDDGGWIVTVEDLVTVDGS